MTPDVEQKIRVWVERYRGYQFPAWVDDIALLVEEVDRLRLQVAELKGELVGADRVTADLIQANSRLRALLTCPLCGNSGEVEARVCPACTEPSTVVQGLLLQNVSILGDK